MGRIEQEITERRYDNDFCYPDYQKYCLSNIPPTILRLYGLKPKRSPLPKKLWAKSVDQGCFDKIVLLLLDGLSYYYWKNALSSLEFFNALHRKGRVYPLTTVFPSTTPAALTTLSTGLTPAQHGLLMWFIYLQELDKAIDLYPYSKDATFGRLSNEGLSSRVLFDGSTIFQKLRNRGIKSFSFIHEGGVDSVYSKKACNGSKRMPYINSSDLSVQLRKKVENVPGSALFNVHWGFTDVISHTFGPTSEELLVEYLSFQYIFMKEFIKKLPEKRAQRTLLLVTSDHGHVPRPRAMKALRQFPSLSDYLRTDADGVPLVTGNPRCTFLHIQEGKLSQAQNLLSRKLKGVKILKKSEVLEGRLLGESLKEKVLPRLGDLVLLPPENVWTWYQHSKKSKIDYIGGHGGLSRKEMIIPFGIASCAELK